MRTAALLLLVCCMTPLLALEPLSNSTLEKLPGVKHETFRSKAMDADIGYNIYLPPGYEESKLRYPVVYYLHGGGDHESSHLVSSRLLDEYIRAGKVQPLIHVHAFGGRKSFYSDAPDAGTIQGESLIKELIQHIDEKYRTIAAKEGRGMHGWSMGGYGALKFAFKYPDLFSVVVGVSGGYFDGPMKDRGGRKGDARPERAADSAPDAKPGEVRPPRTPSWPHSDPEKFKADSPAAWLRKHADQIRGKLGIMLVVGTRDGLIENNKMLHGLLDELKIEHRFEPIAEGQHNPRTLYPQAAEHIFPFLAKHLAQPR